MQFKEYDNSKDRHELASRMIDSLEESIGTNLEIDIYMHDKSIALHGQLITAGMIRTLRRLDPVFLRFSVEERKKPVSDSELTAIIQSDHSELLNEAGIKEVLSSEVREMAASRIAELFEASKYLSEIEVGGMAELASDLIGKVVGFETAALKLTEIRDFDQYTYHHSVNCCVLGTSVFRQLAETDDELIQFGIGLLLHDIGKCKIDPTLLTRKHLTLDELNLMKEHPVVGYSMVENCNDLSPLAKSIILRHHERINGRGYPFGLTESQLTLFEMASSICDSFDAMTSYRPYAPSTSYHRAINELCGGAGQEYQPRLVNTFLRAIGRFPVGTFVQVSSGDIGVVSRIRQDALARPCIRLMFDSTGSRLPELIELDLQLQSDISIAKAFDT